MSQDVERLSNSLGSTTLEERSKASSTQSIDLNLESDSRILGKVLYSRSLETDDGAFYAVQPMKVDSLGNATISATPRLRHKRLSNDS